MITLQKLRWSNCFSYGENNELDLSSNTVTQLVGTNGMGKSSIPLIIEEALYNKNSKGIKKADIPNRYVNQGYSIHLTFTRIPKNMRFSSTESPVLNFDSSKMARIYPHIPQPIPIRHCKILSALISKHSPNWYIKTLAAAYNFSQRPIRIGKNS